MGSLELVAKGNKVTEEDSESNHLDSDISEEDRNLLASNPKKFYKKILSHFQNKYMQGGNYTKARDEGFKDSKTDDERKEKKVLGDSGYVCIYCHGKNHFSKECMHRRMSEKK